MPPDLIASLARVPSHPTRVRCQGRLQQLITLAASRTRSVCLTDLPYLPSPLQLTALASLAASLLLLIFYAAKSRVHNPPCTLEFFLLTLPERPPVLRVHVR